MSNQNPRTNWAGNYTYQAKNFYQPKSMDELKSLIQNADVFKPLGSTHCFNDIADSPVTQISTQHLRNVVALDEKEKTVTIECGMRYGDLAPLLEEKGYALHNLASLPHISVVGACATATHGSGVENGNLASAVVGMEFITPNGQEITLTKDDPDFLGAVVHLGALGMVTQITLEIEETYEVKQEVFQNLPLASAIESFDDIMSGGYSVSLFTDWMNDLVSQVWVKRKVLPGETPIGNDYFGAIAAKKKLHPITRLSAIHCTEQLGEPGPWFERLPHFKMGFTPSSGDELQSEFFVDRSNAVDAFQALERMRDLFFPHLFISEIRSIAADKLWMSTAYQKDAIAFHFTWQPHDEDVARIIPMIEKELAPYLVVPHWGKLFSMDKNKIHERYSRMNDFLALIDRFDPDKRLRNAYLQESIYST